MISIFDYNDNLQKQGNNLISQFKTFLLNSEDLIIVLQQEQLDQGKDKDGRIVGFYSPATEIITNGRKKAGEPFNFQDTGNFFEGMFIKIETSPEFAIIIDSRDPKTTLLENEYGEILGLTQENSLFVVDKLRDLFIRFLTRNTATQNVQL